jgi:hypothetical protein
MALLSSVAAEEPQSSAPDAPSLDFPLGWLLDRATPPIIYRSYVDVAGLPIPEGSDIAALTLSAPTPLALASSQTADGIWNNSMLAIPEVSSAVETGPEVPASVVAAKQVVGVGTIPATRRLLEYGWDRETPPLRQARRILFRLLAEDDDPNYLFEFRDEATNEETALRARNILREAAAAALAQAGYESDPRLRGAARRILERMDEFLDSALAEKPWVRIGNRHVLSADAAPPSIFALTMLAHMPIFRSEHYPEMERLYAYLTQPKPTQESVQLYGKEIINQPHLVLGDLLHNKNVVDNDVPFALMWLETMARLNFLKRNENWMKMFERLVDDRDRYGVWHPHKGDEAPSSANPYVWPMFPLEERLENDTRWTDVTFRIGLIARLLGWQIVVK